MARSFRFEHFTVAKTIPMRGIRRRDKQHLSEKRASGTHAFSGPVHYGHNHAETEELFQVRTMNAQLEALAGLSANAPIKPSATNRGQPIGALPMAEQPPLPRTEGLREAVDEARRHFDALRTGLQDAQQATNRLLSLPLDIARLAMRRLGFVQG